MATINIRIDDRVRDHLKELADEEGVTLSEYARGLLMEATVPVREDANPSGGMAPSTMGLYERQTLSLLHRILGNTLPEGSNGPEGSKEHQFMIASVLESGYSDEYGKESAGIRAELSIRDCGRVKDILDMYREIAYSIEHHQRNSDGLDDDQVFRLEFKGFDHNDALEGHMADYVEYLVGEGLWTSLKPQIDKTDGGNSHGRMLEMYMRMLTEYRRIKDARRRGYDRFDQILTTQELQLLVDAQVHPSNRNANS